MFVERTSDTATVTIYLQDTEAARFTSSRDGNWNELVDQMQNEVRKVMSAVGAVSDLNRTIVGVYCRYDKRIQAIKHLREVTKCGLREAKDYIDEQFPRPTDPYKDGNIPF